MYVTVTWYDKYANWVKGSKFVSPRARYYYERALAQFSAPPKEGEERQFVLITLRRDDHTLALPAWANYNTMDFEGMKMTYDKWGGKKITKSPVKFKR